MSILTGTLTSTVSIRVITLVSTGCLALQPNNKNNILNNSNMTYLFNSSINNKEFTFKGVKVKSNISYDNKFIIEIDANGILDEMSDIDLNNKKNIQEITDNINKEISDKTKEFTDKLILNNSDILGFKKIYYNKKRSELKSINNIEYEVKVKVSLNRKGLIFFSLGGEYEKSR